MPDEVKVLSCSFCNKSQRAVKKLIAGPSSYICNECVDICNDILAEDRGEVPGRLPRVSPLETIRSKLQEAVVGQPSAVSALAGIAYNQYRRACVAYSDGKGNQEVSNKVNCLVLGPRGSGKTLAVTALHDAVDLPFTAIDAIAYGETRYASYEEPMQLLARRAVEMHTAPTFGILFVDNAQVMTTKTDRRAQQTLLPILAGKVTLKEAVYDTRNVLMILAGHFPALEQKLAAKPASTTLDPNLLVEEGFLPEIASHFGTVCRFEQPSAADLRTMLTMPERGIFSSYSGLFSTDGVEVHLSKEAIEAVVQEALRRGTGARALRGIVENIAIAVSSELARKKSKVFEVGLPLVSRIIG
jgi:ATP-dependent Clp protease ATP-binding subunit ClpX